MEILSVHSHKGGAGKTTLTLLLAKAYARARRKVCAVDLDFIGSGFEYGVRVHRKGGRFLDEYILRDAMSPDMPKLDELISEYRDDDLGNGKIDMVFNHGADVAGLGTRTELRKNVGQLAGLEPGAGVVGGALRLLLESFEEQGYDVVLLDCHPGLAHVSISVLRLFKDPAFSSRSTSLFLATPDRPHIFGMLEELNFLRSSDGDELFDPQRAILVVNRGEKPPLLSLAQVQQEITRDDLMPEAGTWWSHLDLVHYCRILERPELREISRIGGPGIIPVPPSNVIKCDDTPLCRKVFAQLGEPFHVR